MQAKASSALCFLLLVLPVATWAKQAPVVLKAGLWKGSAQTDDGRIMERSEICLGDSIVVPEDFLGRSRTFQTPCTVQDREAAGDAVSQTATCEALGHTVQTAMKAKVGPTHWQGVFNSWQDGKPMPALHQTWNWTGPCPAGMKPGQIVGEPRSQPSR